MMMEAEAEEETHFALILGKPGGGKGTISGKILKVRKTKQAICCRTSLMLIDIDARTYIHTYIRTSSHLT